MARDPLELNRELDEVVLRARRLAAQTGALEPVRRGSGRLPLQSEAADVVMELLRDGTYAEAVARVAAHDPDLADE
jgi:hypothetical protein